MRTPVRIAVCCALALAAASCAGPNKLAERSEKALAAGESQKAYEKARSALKKDPENERARRAMSAAAERLAAGRKERMLAVARYDTLDAARQSINFDVFRRELADYRITLETDPEFERAEGTIREGAASIQYENGLSAMEDGHPKAAYFDFLSARDFRSGYRDVESRIHEAFDQAVTRVALLPFSNQTDIRGLPRELADQTYSEIVRRVNPQNYPFTVLLGRDQVYSKVTVADLDHMGRREAIRVGRDLDADRIVSGRFYGLRTKTDTESYHSTIYRKVVEKDEKGASVERFVEREIDVVARTRDVSVRYEFEVLDTEDGSVLASAGNAVDAEARALYTSYQADGDCDDYCLASPALRRADPERAKEVESEWKERFGSWTLPELLERARKDRERTRYRSDYRDEFYGNTAARPVFLGDLPPEDDLAVIALHEVWRPVLSALQELDRK